METNLAQFRIGDLDALNVRSTIEAGLDLQSGLRRSTTNQLHDDFAAQERLSSPVARDLTEQTMFDLVPLAGSRREMADLNVQVQFIGQLLQLNVP